MHFTTIVEKKLDMSVKTVVELTDNWLYTKGQMLPNIDFIQIQILESIWLDRRCDEKLFWNTPAYL